jgi:hypothetical protein
MHWFTLFWIPVLPLWVRHGVICPECGALESVSMLAMRRALRSGRLPLGRNRPGFEAAIRDHLGGAAKEDWAAFGLEPDASESSIRTRWRDLAKSAHPDAGGDAGRFVTLQATFHRLLASLRSQVEVQPDPAEIFDPVMVNPKKGLFDFYSTKLWPAIIILSIVASAARPSAPSNVSAGVRAPNANTVVAPLGTAHQCWYTGTELNGCQDDTTFAMLFGTRTGTVTTCWFIEPLDYGETANCR